MADTVQQTAAPDLTDWAADMADDGLQPYDGAITLDSGGKPFARLHLAFAEDMDDAGRTARPAPPADLRRTPVSYPTLFATPGVRAFAEAVDAERARQIAKFGDQRHPDLDHRDIPVVTHRYYEHQAYVWQTHNEERATPSRSVGRCIDASPEPHTHTAWDGVTNGFGGPTSPWISLMHPGVGELIADWLESAAVPAELGGAAYRALAVARAVLDGAE